MDKECVQCFQQGIRLQQEQSAVPTKCKGMDVAETINAILHNNLALTSYTYLYLAIHHFGLEEEGNVMTNNMRSTILTQYHVSHHLKHHSKKGVNAVLNEL